MRIASFFAVMAVVFAAAVGIGRAVGPTNRSEHGEAANHEGMQFRYEAKVHTAEFTQELK